MLGTRAREGREGKFMSCVVTTKGGERGGWCRRGYSLIVHPSKSRRRPIREQVAWKRLRMADEGQAKAGKEWLTVTILGDGMEDVAE